ncbi:MAG: hypothetical protein ACKO24_12555 [Leptolyngbyaceae cyanobacterium]
MRAVSSQVDPSVRQLVQRILVSGHLTRKDHLKLTSSLLSENWMTDEERHQINRIFDDTHRGRLTLVD